jgi:hypothetical protein
VAFAHGKTEAAIFRRKKPPPTAAAKADANTVPFNKEAARWLGGWLDSQLTLKGHHAIRPKNGKNATAQLRGLAGQMGLPPANCGKVMTACFQLVAVFGSELWRKGNRTRGTHRSGKRVAAPGQPRGASDRRLLPDNQSRGPIDRVRAQNRQRRFGLRLLSLPQGDQAGRLSAPQQRLDGDSRMPSHARAGWRARFL